MANQQNEKHILVIDTSAVHLKEKIAALTGANLSAEGVSRIQGAGQMIRKKQYSVIVLDLKAADHSELGLLDIVRSKSPNTEFIILTEVPSIELTSSTMFCNIFAWIQKPFMMQNLVATVEQALKKYKDSKALSNANNRYQQLYEGAIDGIVTVSLAGDILDFNPAFQKILSYTADELDSMSFWDFTPQKWWVMERKYVDQILERGYSDLYEKEYRDKDGHLVPVEIIGFLNRDDLQKPTSMWAFVRDISKRKESDRYLQHQLLQMTSLHEIASAVTGAANIDDLIELTTQTLGRTLYSDNFGIFVLNSEKHELKPHDSYYGLPEEVKKISAPIQKGITGRCALTGLPQRISDTAKDPDYWEVLPKTSSELCVPIWVNGKIFGVINSESEIANFYSEQDEKMFITLAYQLAAGVEKIKSLENSQQRAREMTALYDTALATGTVLEPDTMYQKLYHQVSNLFPLDGFLLVLVDSQRDALEIAFFHDDYPGKRSWQGKSLAMEESGIIGHVVRSEKPFLSGDLQQAQLPVLPNHLEADMRSWLGVPLQVRGHVIGGISVYSYKADQFSYNHKGLLESMAALVAVALDNSHLLAQAQKQLDRLTALHDIDLVINSSLDLRVTLNNLLDQVVDKLGVDASAVLLLNQKTQMMEYASGRGFHTRHIEQYQLNLGDGLSGQAAVERHLVQAHNIDDLDDRLAYTSLIQEEGFVSYFSVPLIAKGQVKGMLDIFNRSLLNPDQDWVNFLETLAGQAAIAIDNTSLLEDLQKSNIELSQAYDTTLEGWSRALDLRDHGTEGHTQRVIEMTLLIARQVGMTDEDLVHIRRGALLHDIGKIGVPDSILNKPSQLNDEEWQIMHRHPVFAHDLLQPITHLRPAMDIPYCHHERWDGGGYPQGLKGEEIPIAARIFSVVDVWDALTSDRPYRKAWSADKTLDYIKEKRGQIFDPAIVDIFISLMKNKLICL